MGIRERYRGYKEYLERTSRNVREAYFVFIERQRDERLASELDKYGGVEGIISDLKMLGYYTKKSLAQVVGLIGKLKMGCVELESSIDWREVDPAKKKILNVVYDEDNPEQCLIMFDESEEYIIERVKIGKKEYKKKMEQEAIESEVVYTSIGDTPHMKEPLKRSGILERWRIRKKRVRQKQIGQ